ncbi:MAG: site-specific DNA recombinase [Parcubacteria bacterium C7867-001]|nr:MAG: site-specific DNA recombinase [Parcubacteria bacterium C7867-001]
MEDAIITKYKRAAIYLRVSTDEQAKEGHYGLKVQEDHTRKYCEDRGYALNEEHVFVDDGYSGGLEFQDRPAFSELYRVALNKEIDVVVVAKQDRIARDLEVAVLIRRELRKIGIPLESVAEPFDQATPMGSTMTKMTDLFADFERMVIRERTYNGRIRAAKDGKWVTGLPPYGYTIVKQTKKLEIIEREAEVVSQFFQWLVYERLSLHEMERRANSMNLPAPKHKTIRKRVTSNHWYARSIGRILTNEIYAGRAYFRKYKRPYNNLTSLIDPKLLRPEKDWIPFDAPAIITSEMFEAAKKQLLKNREDSERNTRRSYMFVKLLYCGYCNFKLFSGYQTPRRKDGDESSGKYYNGIYRGKNALGNTKRCERCDQYAESRLLPIWDTLKEILQNPENLHDPLRRYRYKEEDKDTIERKIRAREKEIEVVEGKQKRLITLYLDDQFGDINDMKKHDNTFRQERDQLEREIVKLKQGLLTKEDEGNREQVLRSLCSRVSTRLENATYEDKKNILHLFVERITLYAKHNYAEVVFKFPTSTIVSGTQIDVPQKNIPLFLNIKTLPYEEGRLRMRKINPKSLTSTSFEMK